MPERMSSLLGSAIAPTASESGQFQNLVVLDFEIISHDQYDVGRFGIGRSDGEKEGSDNGPNHDVFSIDGLNRKTNDCSANLAESDGNCFRQKTLFLSVTGCVS